MKWYPFDKIKGNRQKRPPIGKWVIVKLARVGPGMPGCLTIGYRKNEFDNAQLPYFVIPGMGGKVEAWCDCLPDIFKFPID